MPTFSLKITLKLDSTIQRSSLFGNMVNNYVPFRNLISSDENEANSNAFSDFNTDKLKWDLKHPVDIKILDQPDGSVNLILNDDINKPMMINSRFSTAENNTYIIPDHFGDKDTSIYEEKNLELDTSLYRIITKIPKVEFLGILDNGFFKCGSYYFYFKLCDNDDNESDFIAESGVVTCHIGNINKPKSIRMGMENENSEKSVRFKLSNLDGAYDYLKVYYSRTTSGEEGSDLTTYFKILQKFPIDHGVIDLQIFGNEPQQPTSLEEINEKFQYCQHVKTLDICQNRLFLGNIQKPIIDYEKLLQFALNIIPNTEIKDSIGLLDSLYIETSRKNSFGYYNSLNTYYRLGYWPEEYYRFGIVFIMNDFTLSDVYNVRGINLQKSKDTYTKYYDSKELVLHLVKFNEDGYLLDLENNIVKNENNLGITILDSIPEEYALSKPLGITFKLSEDYLNKDDKGNTKFDDIKKIVKGFFFVRLKRKPIILAQGYSIGKTKKNFGNIPCLKLGDNYFTESFLDYDKNATVLKASKVNIKEDNVEVKAAIVPDAIIREPLFNLIFLGQDFRYDSFMQGGNLIKNSHLYYPKSYVSKKPNSGICKFLNIPSGIKLTTNNTDYFCSLAGVPEDVKDFISVLHDWKHEGSATVTIGKVPPNNFMRENVAKCIPFNLKKDRVIRGMFGSYVGLSSNTLDYGEIFNIRKDDYDPDSEEYLDNQIKIRKYDYSPYSAISDRLEIDELGYKKIYSVEEKDYKNVFKDILCYRGDCYICNFTHRIIRNHIDPELPTNNKIIDNLGWDDNFLVLTKTKFNDPESPTGYTYINEIIPEFKAKNLFNPITGKPISGAKAAVFFAGLFGLPAGKDITKTFESDLSDLNWKKDSLSIILPSDSKYSKIGNGAEAIGIPNTWYEYGTNKINRSDVNSVNLGHWITIKVMSNYNLCLRDIDPYHTDEKVIFSHPRGFYPYHPLSISSEYKLPESKLINGGSNLNLSLRFNFTLPETSYINQQYDTRILYSDVYSGGFKNGFRIFRFQNYRDFPKTYGALVKLVEWHGDLIAVMEHGILKIPVNERTIGGDGSGGNVYINTDNVLPQNPVVISDTFGTIWGESILKTDAGIYGIDTYAKKIWVTDGNSQPTLLSDFKLQKYLNDNINLSEWDKECEIGFTNVKTHFNAFKRDIMFTFYNDDKIWNLCYNEYLGKFITFYSWTPSYSENINNIFISFDINDSRNIIDSVNGSKNTNFYKHLVNRMELKLINDIDLRFYIDDKYTINTNILEFDLDPTYVVGEELVDLDNGLKHPYPRLYDSLTHPDNKYVQFTKILDPDADNKLIGLILKFNPEYKEELKYKKYLNIKFKAFYYLDNYLDTDPTKINETLKTLKQKDLYLRLYNPNKCTNELWKHGQAGIFDGQGKITPTKWYGQQEPFEFEFVISEAAAQLKVFYTLMLLSNKTQPNSFEFEIVGESYDWYKYKDVINWANHMSANEEDLINMYKEILLSTLDELKNKYVTYPGLDDVEGNYIIKSLPFIRHIRKDSLGVEHNNFEKNTTEVQLIEDDLLKEKRIRQSQTCNNIKKMGRIAGNSEYLEDNWYIEIRPMNFKTAFINKDTQDIDFKKIDQLRIRDKYIKIKVKYSGEDLALIQGIQTLFDYSYA